MTSGRIASEFLQVIHLDVCLRMKKWPGYGPEKLNKQNTQERNFWVQKKLRWLHAYDLTWLLVASWRRCVNERTNERTNTYFHIFFSQSLHPCTTFSSLSLSLFS